MAERPLRVLVQFSSGLPWRRASEEERKKANESDLQISKKWKASGVQFIGYFGAPAGLEGFTHSALFGVKDIKQVQEMADDLFASEWGKYVEKYRLVIGWGWTEVEEWWKSL